MAALLVGMSVAAVLMTAVMPVWKQMAKRERETELVFRGQQYVRAIGLFQKRSGPGVLPPSVDVLVSGRFLRKKFRDPITNQDFDLLSPTQAAGQPGAPGQGSAQPPAGGRGFQPQTAPQGQGRVVGAQPQGAGGTATGGIIGVASKSKEESLRIFNGRTHYNEWQFIFVQQATPGQGGPGAPGGPGRGGAGGGVGGRGQTPPAGGVGGGRGGTGRGSGPVGPQGGQPPQPPSQPGPFVPPRPR